MQKRLSKFSRIALVLASFMLIAALFVPVWVIYLDAPQYPEGLRLQIWAYKLSGDVEVINGLNHYIGMKTLHTEDFIEFKLLPFLLGGFAVFFIITAFINRRRGLYAAFFAFLLFGIVAMADFWVWEYQYGHDLDPNAAIKVPGMAYQPPLIGFKQLLNFGAFSIPDVGGWLFIGAGILLLTGLLKEKNMIKLKKRLIRTHIFSGVCLLFVIGCQSPGPMPIALNQDNCDYCRMTISDGHFGAEAITNKGRVYKFDDVSCLLGFAQDQGNKNIRSYFVHDYSQANVLIDATKAVFVHHEAMKSPMGGNFAAFNDQEAAGVVASKYGSITIGWEQVVSMYQTANNAEVQDHAH